MIAVLAEFNFMDAFWSMIVFVAWVVWLIILFTVFIDLFRRHDIGGGKKVLWFLFLILLPFIGVFTYIILNSHSMAERKIAEAAESQRQMDEYVRSVSPGGSPTEELAKAKGLLDQGAITQEEFDVLKAKLIS